MQTNVTNSKFAWSLQEISETTGLSLGFLRNDVRRGALRVKKFGRRVLILEEDFRKYLTQGESVREREGERENEQ